MARAERLRMLPPLAPDFWEPGPDLEAAQWGWAVGFVRRSKVVLCGVLSMHRNLQSSYREVEG